MSTGLTEDQKRQIEENRQKALARRAERLTLQRRQVLALQNSAFPSDHQNDLQFAPNLSHPRLVQQSKSEAEVTSPVCAGQQKAAITDIASQAQVTLDDGDIRPTVSSAQTDSNIKSILPFTTGETNMPAFYGSEQEPWAGTNQVIPRNVHCQLEKGCSSSAGSSVGNCWSNNSRGSCVQHSEGRFQVEIGFNADLISVFKTIPSRNFDTAAKMWNFSLDDYSNLMERIKQVPRVTLKPLDGIPDPETVNATSPLSKIGRRGSSALTVNQLAMVGRNWKKPGAEIQGRFGLLSRSRCEVEIGYHAEVLKIFQQVISRNYDMKTRKWSFLLQDYRVLLDALSRISSVQVEPFPRGILEVFLPQFGKTCLEPQEIPEADLSGVDSKLVHSLMPFQRDGVNFAIFHGGRLLLADDMGLGKTLQAICIAAVYRKEWPVLVVTPSSVRFTWAQAFSHWLPSLQTESINVVLTGKDRLSSSCVSIISYDLLAKLSNQLAERHFQVVIVDESHFLKNMKTVRCKAARPLLQAAKRLILLSGTPAMSRPAELHSQITALRPKLFPNFHDFGMRYCAAKRHTDKIWSVFEFGQVSANLYSYDNLSNPWQVLVHLKREKKEALLLFYNHTAEAKVRSIVEYVRDLLESGREKFLVFGHHRLVLDTLCAALEEKGVAFIRIDGSTSSSDRQSLCDRFQFSETRCVAVLSITAANMGLTLSSADLVVIAELFWNPGILFQAEDRVHRIGQSNCVDIHYLVARGTADDYLWPIIQEKVKVLGQAGLSDNNFSETETTDYFHRGPRQVKVVDFFQTAFADSEDTDDEARLLEAANLSFDSDPNTGTGNSTGTAQQPPYPESPLKKRRIEEYFGK
ncbi:SWI/SNF-related matrix-associated actin-dependent regulator of chromatin subfamily A-like protein 1 [Heterodontus francisci]|uniref:SWI/SNF-related matrix-associated actin-dependent regulator of chromatin subfamily A-like protein 1 n=1 Tax=Heterodontus francisci TaxID=7792 RepID=UPI00355B87D3